MADEKVEVVDPGNTVKLVAPFLSDPEEINFSYMKPGSARPIVDPGWVKSVAKPGSRIVRLDEGIYQYVIDTTGFRGGVVKWHFWGAGNGAQASRFGEFSVRDTPPQLL